MTKLFTIGPVSKKTVKAALKLNMQDYEDAIQAACAKEYRAEVLITNNVKDFTGSPVKPMTSQEFVGLYCT